MIIQEILLFMLIYFGSYDATVTAYSPATTDPRWNHVARWTGEPPVVGITAACPAEWKEQWVYIQSYGWRRCDDTPRDGWYGDSPHIDIHLATHEAAINHGVQHLTIWKARD